MTKELIQQVYFDSINCLATQEDFFKAGETEFIDLIPGRKVAFAEKVQMITMLRLAREAVSDPIDSGFYVRAILANQEGGYGLGGNKEAVGQNYAYVHGETVALSDYIQKNGSEKPIKYLGFYNEKPSTVSPCGQCRDSLRGHLDLENGLGFEGVPGKTINIVPLKAFYFEDFQAIETVIDKQALDLALEALDRSYNPYSKSDTVTYGTTIRMIDGQMYSAGEFTNAGYYQVGSLAAVINSIKPGKQIAEFFPQKIVLALKGETIPYADRQFLEEYRAGLAAYLENPEINFPIYIFETGGRRDKLWATDAREWLPLPFSPAEFGMDKFLAESFERRFVK